MVRSGIGLVAAAAIAAASSGCGFGPGESTSGEATLTVTRDYGAEPILEATESDPTESETVIRFLDREADVGTRYGGGFVQSIDGISGELAGGRSRDWFFFVNGIESPRGSADAAVRAGDRIWWDYRDWTDAMRAPAVVGSWPEPFAQASAGTDRLPVRIVCGGERPACEEVAERLSEEGVEASVEAGRRTEASADEPAALRLLVGPWARLHSDDVADQLDEGPATSGVFARFERDRGRYELVALDRRASQARTFGAGAGLVAGLREGAEPPTWLVTGTDARGVREAVAVLDAEHLADHYAVLAADGAGLALPAGGGA
ncbi:MAG: DUF4430 domain-containing protein [Solirubrobacterales bacterium]|nr:DUF4430 domain-containing protein [Solirubrobacterales bacterium]